LGEILCKQCEAHEEPGGTERETKSRTNQRKANWKGENEERVPGVGEQSHIPESQGAQSTFGYLEDALRDNQVEAKKSNPLKGEGCCCSKHEPRELKPLKKRINKSSLKTKKKEGRRPLFF